MAIHCRRGRTEVELVGGRSNTLAGRNKADTVVTYSINDGASIARVWGARGSVASFKGDVVAFLRSLPDNGELAARIQDGNATLQEGRFVLDGLTQVRDKFALACRWPEADDDAAAAAKSAEAAAAEQTSNLRGRHRDQIQKSLPVRSVRDPRSRQRGDAPVEIAGLAQTGTDAQLQPKACGPCQLEAFKVMAGDRWVISETTSPVDYSPIVTASILLQSGASRLKLSIICRRGRTDLELASDLPDIAAPKSARDVVVTHSINRDAAVEHRWDARGSVAYFKGDAVAFLRSLRDDGEIAVRISDGNSVLHEGRFVLDGLSYVRDKFASACKWPESGGPPSSQVESTMRKTSRRGKTQ
jgi:hypothetical protein